MNKIEINQQHLDFIKKIKGKYAIDPKFEEIMKNTNQIPITLKLNEQQYINLIQLLFDVSSEDTDVSNIKFANEWIKKVYVVNPKFR